MTKSPFRLIFLTLLLCAAWLSLVHGVSAQEAGAPAQRNVFQTIIGSGPLGIAIWCAILGASITMVTFVIQNILTLRTDRLAPPPLVASLRQVIAAGNYQEAWEICNANRNYLANTLKAGLERIGRGKAVFDDALAEHGLREAQLLRTRNSYLSVIGVVSPMIGLLGTVIGMMGAFSVLGSSGIGDPRALAGKIGEVLLATASGLFIAIPAFVSYYIFRNRAQAAIVNAEDRLNSLVDDVPFEELAGVRIGENFSAGAGAMSAEDAASLRVSMALTTNCPVCSATINPGQSPCPNCGATLDWKQWLPVPRMSEQRDKARLRARKNAVRAMPEEDPDFQIAPMIDVLLVLLVFFMSISSTEVLQATKNIELPVAANGNDSAKNKGQVIVNIAWLTSSDVGTITVDEKNYPNPNDLTPLLAQRATANPATRVLIRADKQTRYDFMRAVMVAVAQAKIGNVTFSVVDKEGPKTHVAEQ